MSEISTVRNLLDLSQVKLVQETLSFYFPNVEQSADDWSAEQSKKMKRGDLLLFFKPLESKAILDAEGLNKVEILSTAFVFREDAGYLMSYYMDYENYEMGFVEGLLAEKASEAKAESLIFSYVLVRPINAPSEDSMKNLANMHKWGGAGLRSKAPMNLPDPMYYYLTSIGAPIDPTLANEPLSLSELALALLLPEKLGALSKVSNINKILAPISGDGGAAIVTAICQQNNVMSQITDSSVQNQNIDIKETEKKLEPLANYFSKETNSAQSGGSSATVKEQQEPDSIKSNIEEVAESKPAYSELSLSALLSDDELSTRLDAKPKNDPISADSAIKSVGDAAKQEMQSFFDDLRADSSSKILENSSEANKNRIDDLSQGNEFDRAVKKIQDSDMNFEELLISARQPALSGFKAFKNPSKPQTAEPVIEKAEPVLEKAEPVVEKAEPVLDKAEPVVEKAEPVVEKAEPVLEKAEPVVETAEPVLETAEPVLDKAEPVVEKAEPVLEKAEPVLEKAEPVLDKAEPVLEKAEPVIEKIEAVVDKAEPVLDKAEPVIEKAEPVLDKAEPVIEKAEPVLEKAEPVLEKAEPVLEKAEPVLETAEPVLEKAEPVVEKAEPVLEKAEPVLEKAEPVLEKAEPVVEKAEPVLDKAEPVIEKAEPVVDKAEPVLDKAEPVLEKAEPVVEKAEPVLEKAEPVLEKAEPVLEKAEPVVEKAEPVLEKAEPVIEKIEAVVDKAEPAIESKAEIASKDSTAAGISSALAAYRALMTKPANVNSASVSEPNNLQAINAQTLPSSLNVNQENVSSLVEKNKEVSLDSENKSQNLELTAKVIDAQDIIDAEKNIDESQSQAQSLRNSKKMNVNFLLEKIEEQKAEAYSGIQAHNELQNKNLQTEMSILEEISTQGLSEISRTLGMQVETLKEELRNISKALLLDLKSVSEQSRKKIENNLLLALDELKKDAPLSNPQTIAALEELKGVSSSFQSLCNERIDSLSQSEKTKLGEELDHILERIADWRENKLNTMIVSIDEMVGRLNDQEVLGLQKLEQVSSNLLVDISSLIQIDSERFELLNAQLLENLEQVFYMIENKLINYCGLSLADQIFPSIAKLKNDLNVKAHEARLSISSELSKKSEASLADFAPIVDLGTEAISIIEGQIQEIKENLQIKEKESIEAKLEILSHSLDSNFAELKREFISDTGRSGWTSAKLLSEEKERLENYAKELLLKVEQTCLSLNQKYKKESDEQRSARLEILESSFNSWNDNLSSEIKNLEEKSQNALDEVINKIDAVRKKVSLAQSHLLH